MVSTLKHRRDFSCKRINEIPGLTAKQPAGAFYLFPRIHSTAQKWKSDEEFVMQVLEETGVLVVHGSGFDPQYGKDHFRAVFLPEESVLEEAFTAIEDFMKRNT
jgi:aspartate/methionine/tyrosine aminotransferase